MSPDALSTSATPKSPSEDVSSECDPLEMSCFGLNSELPILFLPVAKRNKKKKTFFTIHVFICFVAEKKDHIILLRNETTFEKQRKK